MCKKLLFVLVGLSVLGCDSEEPVEQPAASELAVLLPDAGQRAELFEKAAAVERLGEARPRDVGDSPIRVTDQLFRLRFDPGSFLNPPGGFGGGLPGGGSLTMETMCIAHCFGQGCQPSGCLPNGTGGCTMVICTGDCDAGGGCDTITTAMGDENLLRLLRDEVPGIPGWPEVPDVPGPPVPRETP